MPCDEKLANRIRQALAKEKGVSERVMSGGIAFMLCGSICCGVVRDLLMARIGPDGYEEAILEPHVQPMAFTGRSFKGYMFVGPDGCQTDEALRRWVLRAVRFTSSLPSKAGPG